MLDPSLDECPQCRCDTLWKRTGELKILKCSANGIGRKKRTCRECEDYRVALACRQCGDVSLCEQCNARACPSCGGKNFLRIFSIRED